MDITFRSCDRLDQAQFARWLQQIPAHDLHHYELLDGHVVREPPAGWPHGEVEGELVRRLATHAKRRRAGRVFGSSQGFELPTGDTVEPDVSFVSHARWRAAQPKPGFLRLVPELVFEILSPATARIDKVDKKRIYERNGVRELVLVDVNARTVQRFAATGGQNVFDGERTYAEHDVYVSTVLADLAFTVGELFVDL